MSTDSSTKSSPSGDKFAPYDDAEDTLRREIASCHDVEVKVQLTWKLATFYLETARPEKSVAHLQWIVAAGQNAEKKNAALRILRFLYGSEENEVPILDDTLDLSRILWEMGNGFLGKGNQQPGMLCLLRLLDISTDREQRAECFLLLGVECEKEDNYAMAISIYQRGIECEPKEIRSRYFLYNNLGYCLNRLGLHEEAESICKSAIEIEPRKHNAHKNLGVALQGQGKFPEAALSYLAAAFLCPEDSRSLDHIEELLANHREEVEQEIPDISDGLASAVEARKRLVQ